MSKGNSSIIRKDMYPARNQRRYTQANDLNWNKWTSGLNINIIDRVERTKHLSSLFFVSIFCLVDRFISNVVCIFTDIRDYKSCKIVGDL